MRTEKRIQHMTSTVKSRDTCKPWCEHENGLCPAGWLNEQSVAMR